MMEELMVYLLKSALLSSFFYALYWCFLRNETFYRFNRHFLLAGLLSAIFLPWIKVSYEIVINIQTSMTEAQAGLPAGPVDAAFPSWITVLFSVYVLLAGLFIIRHIAGLLKIRKIVATQGYTLHEGYKVINTPMFKSSFSVFNYIFIDISSDASEAERKLIIAHEMAHVKQLHWADLLLVQLCCALQWFNPVMWLYLNAVKENHEFLADASVLQQGNSPARYRAALINHGLQTQVFSFASTFSGSDQLKRIKMMMARTSKPQKKLTVLLVLPAVALFLYAFAEPQYTVLETKNTAVALRTVNTKALDAEGSQQIYINTEPAEERSSKPVPAPAVKLNVPQKEKKQLSSAQAKAVHLITVVNTSGQQHIAGNADTTVREQMTVTATQSKITIVQNSAPAKKVNPLILLDGVVVSSMANVKPADIASVNVIKGESAIEKYGNEGRNGVVEIHSKKPAPLP